MESKLAQELKQTKPFWNREEELWLNLARTAAALGHSLEQRLRPHGLSPTQYNVLRILRGAGDEGLCQYEIGDRLVAQVPDVPRIVDRMEKAGWLKRRRGSADRRVVMAELTSEGHALVDTLDKPMEALLAGMFQTLSDADKVKLNELLITARNSPEKA